MPWKKPAFFQIIDFHQVPKGPVAKNQDSGARPIPHRLPCCEAKKTSELVVGAEEYLDSSEFQPDMFNWQCFD